LFGLAAYLGLYVPDSSEGLTGILTSLSLGNVIRYYFDPSHTGPLPVTTYVLIIITFGSSFIFLYAGFQINKLVSSMKFNEAARLSTGAYSIRVDGIQLTNAKEVCLYTLFVLLNFLFFFLDL
jgi:hypothetical protein